MTKKFAAEPGVLSQHVVICDHHKDVLGTGSPRERQTHAHRLNSHNAIESFEPGGEPGGGHNVKTIAKWRKPDRGRTTEPDPQLGIQRESGGGCDRR
ncbi:hypothetical protein ACN2XU_21140 [Primorskyibacter sp. 2E107]|uniref:hypothetical protein n=1 Tax=Primorskyibacter sp. 2E107 TaxID=3403458 RepID=UPI003AF4202B